jgi:outer membrane protein
MRLSLFALLLAGAGPLTAQTVARDSLGPTPVLTLEEAQTLARRNNPAYLQTANNVRTANAALRTARAAYLPQLDASFGTSYRQGGSQIFNGVAFGAASDVISSSYGLDVTMQVNSATFMNPRLQHANVRAAEADVTGYQSLLRTSVAQQYLTVLQQQARAGLQDTLLLNTQAQLALAQARAAVGAATTLDVRRAEVAVGQQQVAVLDEHNKVEIEKLRLFQQLGVTQPPNVVLSSTFTVTEPAQSLDQLLDLARRENPTIKAFRARESASQWNYRTAQAQYSPTLSLRTGWGGYTNQLTDLSGTLAGQRASIDRQQASCFAQQAFRDSIAGLSGNPALCQSIQFTAADEAALRNQNRQFPFNFTKDPWSVSASLSLPIFNGFQREQRIQEAIASREDARYLVRAQELQLTQEVTGAYLNLTTAVKTVAINEQNSRTAREALSLAEERYRVGANTFVDVAQARSDYERAENDRITAIYNFHKAYAALESAVGRPLR